MGRRSHAMPQGFQGPETAVCRERQAVLCGIDYDPLQHWIDYHLHAVRQAVAGCRSAAAAHTDLRFALPELFPALWRQCASGQLGSRAHQGGPERSEEHTSELQSLMRISYAVFCLKK